ncbi:hypothetical protein ACFE04_006610 [Oxalis oulophora]
MALFMFHKAVIFIMIVLLLVSVESTTVINFHEFPPLMSRYSTALFRYSVEWPDGSDACSNRRCSFYCEIDGQILTPCPAGTVFLKNLTVNHQHKFLLNVTTQYGEQNSSAYSWFVDAVPPTATISSEKNYTNAKRVIIDITFSKPCLGNGGFKCTDSFNCDVIVDGPAQIDYSSLRVIERDVKYRLGVFLSETTYGRVVIGMADSFCKDLAGNNFTRTNGSTIIIHFDRRPVWVDLWTSVPSYELEINGASRTVFATNSLKELEIFLDFSLPIVNSTRQILDVLRVNSGKLLAVHRRNQGNRRFLFKLKSLSKTEIIKVELQAELLIAITGSTVFPVGPVTFLYDLTNPRVDLRSSSPRVTKDRNMNAIVEFTKPIFGFDGSMVQVFGGKLTRQELSRALYSIDILVVAHNEVSISIPAGIVNDVSGNLNLASNQLQVKHYYTPSISMALHSFMTAGILATSLAAALLSISSANLGAVTTLYSGSNNIITSDPSMNLQGMIGHLQVFVLSDWLLANQPIEYSETTKGLRWIIPRQKLPWHKVSTTVWPNHVNLAETFTRRFSNSFVKIPPEDGHLNHTNLTLSNSSCFSSSPSNTTLKRGCLHRQHNVSMKDISYGQPLSSDEYFTYFLRGEPLSASTVAKKMEKDKGWQDMEMNLFWLAIGGGSLLLAHVLILLFLRWRTGTSTHGILSIPRFELLLLILVLPCISQSAAFVMRGGTMGGIIVGALLLAIPAALLLSVFLFIVITIFFGTFAQYKEIRQTELEEPWHKKLLVFFIGRPVIGKWFYREGLPLSFLPRSGILFENRKGPALYIFSDLNSMPKWTDSCQSGIGRMRAVSSDDSNEEMKIQLSRRLLGCAQSSYIVLDLLRRIVLGILSGAYPTPKISQSIFALMITLAQFIYLIITKPYIRRGVHIVESISLLCQIGIFGLSISIDSLKSNPFEAKNAAYIMLSLLFISFTAQITNEWYALMKSLLRLSYPDKNSFKLGFKFAAKGLILPFLPRKYWSRVIPLKTGLVPCPETEFGKGPHVESFRAISATVVPVISPGCSPGFNNVSQTTMEMPIPLQEGKREKGIKLESKDDMKRLRELAKASFQGKEASSSSSHPRSSTSKLDP